MQMWQGFKCSAYMYEKECVFILDSCCRFMSTKTCLDRINEIYDEVAEKVEQQDRDMTDRDITIFQEKVKAEMVGKSVITCYGKRQTYRVD